MQDHQWSVSMYLAKVVDWRGAAAVVSPDTDDDKLTDVRVGVAPAVASLLLI